MLRRDAREAISEIRVLDESFEWCGPSVEIGSERIATERALHVVVEPSLSVLDALQARKAENLGAKGTAMRNGELRVLDAVEAVIAEGH